jgi:hypothetical protein
LTKTADFSSSNNKYHQETGENAQWRASWFVFLSKHFLADEFKQNVTAMVYGM